MVDESNEEDKLLEAVVVVGPREGTSASFFPSFQEDCTSSTNNHQVYYTLDQLKSFELIKIVESHIFEDLCHAPDNCQLITECLEKGCDLHKKSSKCDHFPIHCAAKSGCAENLEALLIKDLSIINQLDSNKRTALHIIIESINADNYKTSFEAIKTLLRLSADINCHNMPTLDTPLNLIVRLQNKIADHFYDVEWQELIKFIGDEVFLIDCNSLKKDDVQNILQSCYPDLQEKWTVDDYSGLDTRTIVCKLLKLEDEQQMIRTLYTISKDPKHDNIIEDIIKEGDLLKVVIKAKLNNSIERILKIGEKYVTKETLQHAIRCAISYGHESLFKLLLDIWYYYFQYGTYTQDLLHFAWIESTTFDMLLSHPTTELNSVDCSGQSALYIHTYLNYKVVIKKLLEKNAFIGSMNSQCKYMPMNLIDPEILEVHFDSCINKIGIQKPGIENDLEYIEYNYTCLKPPSKYRATVNELTAINRIASNKKLQHLIQHPLITSFLLLKWNLLSPIFYLNLIVYVINFIMLTGYITFYYGQKDTIDVYAWMPFIFALTICIREAIQLKLLSFKRYFASISNWIELALIAQVLWLTFYRFELDSNRRAMGALTILLAAIELMLLFGTIPIYSLSLYMRMLKKVSATFMHAFASYFVILLAFASSFYILFGLYGEQKMNNSADSENSLQITNPAFAILKTIVMFTGEFNASDLNFEFSNLIGYFIFVMFVFFIAIIMMNLLSGLAVSDTQQIISDATLDDWIVRAKLLERFEEMLITNKTLDDLIPDELKSHTVKILINDSVNKSYPANVDPSLIFKDPSCSGTKTSINTTITDFPAEAETEHRFWDYEYLKRYPMRFLKWGLNKWTKWFLKNFSTSQYNIVRESLLIFLKRTKKEEEEEETYEYKFKEGFKQLKILEEKLNEVLQKVDEFKNKEQENYEDKFEKRFNRYKQIIMEEKLCEMVQTIEECEN